MKKYKILENIPKSLKKKIEEIINQNPNLEDVFLDMIKNKKKAFESNDLKLLTQIQSDEESFILKLISKYTIK